MKNICVSDNSQLNYLLTILLFSEVITIKKFNISKIILTLVYGESASGNNDGKKEVDFDWGGIMIASRQARCLAIFILETGVSAKRQDVWLLIAERIDGRGGKPMTNYGQREVAQRGRLP